MSIEAITAVLQHSHAKGSARLVLVSLAWHANGDGVAWPSQATLAKHACINRRNVRKALAALLALGEIVPVGTAKRGVVSYRIMPGNDRQHRSQETYVDNDKVGRRRPRSQATPVSSDRGGRSQETYDPRSQETYEPLIEPSLEPSESSSTGEQAVCLWNELADELGLVRVQRLTPSRRSALNARLAETGGLDGWRVALEVVRSTPFLRGEGDAGWRVTFDWLIDETNLTKILEKTYETWAQPANGDGRGARGRSRRRASHDAMFAALTSWATRDR